MARLVVANQKADMAGRLSTWPSRGPALSATPPSTPVLPIGADELAVKDHSQVGRVAPSEGRDRRERTLL
jgi:hypothetical protein